MDKVNMPREVDSRDFAARRIDGQAFCCWRDGRLEQVIHAFLRSDLNFSRLVDTHKIEVRAWPDPAPDSAAIRCDALE